MTNKEILKIAMEQSAIDLGATASDFEKSENVIVISKENERARFDTKRTRNSKFT